MSENSKRRARLLATIASVLAWSLCCPASGIAQVAGQPPRPPIMATVASEGSLVAARELLENRGVALAQDIEAFNQVCDRDFVEGSAPQVECANRRAPLVARFEGYNADWKGYESRLSGSMVTFARQHGWSSGEVGRLQIALRDLALPEGAALNPALVIQIWTTMRARNADRSLAAAAAAGDGPGLYAAGQQSFADCAIFALATASGRPYGFVAALGAELIRRGEWHSAADQGDPQGVMEHSGLNGGEVIMIAETLGQAEIVPASGFRATLRSGRPVMIAVSMPDGGRHEIVLSKTFQRGGKPWYEIIDSNEGSQQRLYVSADELRSIMRENGVSYQPDRLKTVGTLRSSQ